MGNAEPHPIVRTHVSVRCDQGDTVDFTIQIEQNGFTTASSAEQLVPCTGNKKSDLDVDVPRQKQPAAGSPVATATWTLSGQAQADVVETIKIR